MSDQVIAAIINSFAVIIAALIAWRSGRGKSKEPLIIQTESNTTEYVPVPIFLENEGLISKLTSFVRRFLTIVIVMAVFGGLGAGMWGNEGLAIGVLIGLIASYLIIRRINRREAN